MSWALTQVVILAALTINYAYSEILPKKDSIGNRKSDTNRKNPSVSSFSEYMKKFDPLVVSQNLLDLQKNQAFNFTRREYLDLVFERLDSTEDLLKLNVTNGDMKILSSSKDTRRWRPPLGPMIQFDKDEFSLRRRFYELMKQAIYQARNKMIIMQMLRDKYRPDPLYKMGYLMGKTDTACKKFAKLAFRSFRVCTQYRILRMRRFSVYESLVLEEHLLHLLTVVERLTELVQHNDDEIRMTARDHKSERKKHWNFLP